MVFLKNKSLYLINALVFLSIFNFTSCKSSKHKKESLEHNQIDENIDNNIDSIKEKHIIFDKKTMLNVRDFGAKGDFIHDDTKAIQSCFNELQKKGEGIVYFPKGVYKISRTDKPGKAYCLLGIDNISIIGESRKGSIIKLAQQQKNFTRMLVFEGNKNVKIENITFDGNVSSQVNPEKPNEHLGGIFIDHSSNVNISNANFVNTGGDGIGIRGVKVPSSNINIQNCYFNKNQRNGITLGSGFKDILIENNFFGKDIDDSPIDSEPENGIAKNVKIYDNVIYTPTLLTLGGNKRCVGSNFDIRNNKLYNCSVFIHKADSLYFKNNTIKINKSKRAAITFLGSNTNVFIENNIIEIREKPAFYMVKTQHSKYAPSDIVIKNNKIKVEGSKAFDIRGANKILISDNDIISNNGKVGIYCFSNYPMNDIVIKGNRIKGFEKGVRLNAYKNNPIRNVKIKQNRFDSVRMRVDAKLNGVQSKELLKGLKIDKN